MNFSNLGKLTLAILISELAGIIGSLFTAPAISTWYASLARPALAPPNWVFGPVWITLYALMGIAAFLVWKRGWERKDVKTALAIFSLQLILNTLWTIIFFGMHSLGGALIEIIILWFAILATMVSFYRISTWATYLLFPYLLWVTFAGYLSYMFWSLN